MIILDIRVPGTLLSTLPAVNLTHILGYMDAVVDLIELMKKLKLRN